MGVEVCMACLRRRKECNVLLIVSSCHGHGRGVAMGVGNIPVRLEAGEIMRSRPGRPTLGRTSKVSGGLVNFFV